MPVCSEMPWGGPFHGPHGFGRGWAGRGGCGRGGFGGCGRGGGLGGWGARGMGPWGYWGHHGPHHGPHGHRGHHHGPPPPAPHCGPPPAPHCPPHHGGPRGGFHGGCRGGMGGGPMRGRGGVGSCARGGFGSCARGGFGSRGRMGPWGWGPFGTGPRRWSSRPGAFDAPFDDRLLVAMLLNFDLPDFSRDGDTGEEVPPSAPEHEAEPETTESETNTIRIDTRRFNPEDIRVSFCEGELRVSAAHTDDSGEQVTLTRSATLRPGSKVIARLAADGFLYIRAEEPVERDVPVQVEEQGQE